MWLLDNVKFLVNCVLLNQMNNIHIYYYLEKENLGVIENVGCETKVGEEGVYDGVVSI